ncbi:hypothetical protein CapIbe_011006 [Capra ibex]
MLVTQHARRNKNRDSKIIFLPVVPLNYIGTEDIEIQGKLPALKYSRDKPSHLEMRWAFTAILLVFPVCLEDSDHSSMGHFSRLFMYLVTFAAL